MTKQTPYQFLEDNYIKVMSSLGSGNEIKSALSSYEKELLNIVLRYAEQAKGVLTVLMTSVVYKILHPEQDIRNHQSSIKNGYSGRTFDTQFITPFMKTKKFPAMAESGWLTRSLEQKVPYDKQYFGAINPPELKLSFLGILESIENKADAEAYFRYLLQGLILQRNKHSIELAKPTALPISNILALLEKHFNHKYQAEGASRLPVLAIYAAYQALLPELKRYEGKSLLLLKAIHHLTAEAVELVILNWQMKSNGLLKPLKLSTAFQLPYKLFKTPMRNSIKLQLTVITYYLQPNQV